MNFDDYGQDDDSFSDPELSFKDYLARGEYVKALELAERNRLDIKPNKCISSIEDLALKAAFEYQSEGDYKQAFNTMYAYAQKNPLTKEFARHFAMTLVEDLVYAYDNSDSDESLDKIKELKHGLCWLENKLFPEGLYFEKKGPVSVQSIVDGARVSKVFENYFVEVADYFDSTKFAIENQFFEHVEGLSRDFDVVNEKVYSNLAFTGTAKK